VVAGAAVLRLVLAALVPLVPDEVYYWEWSRHLAAGYFDHPPAIAWLIRAGTLVAGDTRLGVRLPALVVGFGGCAMAVALAHRLGGPGSALRSALFMSAVPLAGVGLVLATPDVPLLASAAAMLWALDHALERDMGPAGGPSRSQPPASIDARTSLFWWVVLGVTLGIGLLSKYPAVLVPAAVALGCAISRPLRAELARPGPYVACVIGAAMFLPVVLWNASHGWISFAFQLRHGLGPPRGSAWGREIALLGIQLGLVTPILFPLIVVAVCRAAGRPRAPRPFILAAVALFVWIFFVITSVRRPAEPNWPALALLPGIVLLAAQQPSVRQARWEWGGIALGLVVIVVVYSHAVHPWLPIAGNRDPIAQAYGWDELARAVVAEDQRLLPAGTRVWVAADRYQEAAELAYHLPRHPVVFSLELASRHNQFDLWPTARDSVRIGDAMTVVLNDTPGDPAPVRRLAPSFAQVIRGAQVQTHWGAGRIVARYRLWHFVGLTVPLSTTLGPPPS